jgi:hypothetical protein
MAVPKLPHFNRILPHLKPLKKAIVLPHERTRGNQFPIRFAIPLLPRTTNDTDVKNWEPALWHKEFSEDDSNLRNAL